MTAIAEVTLADVGNAVTKTPAGRIGCCASVVGFIALILFVPCSITQLGQKKLGLTKNTITGVVGLDNTFTPGRYYIGFWKEFLEFPSTLNTIEFSDEQPESGVEQLGTLRSRDQDGKRIELDLSLQYRLNAAELGQLYRKLQLNYESVYISALRDALSKVGNKFAIARVWENYSEINEMMRQACRETLAERHAECWDLQLWRVRLEDRYEDALVRTQVRKQAQKTEEARKMHSAVRAKTQVVLAEYRKNITVINSTGIAQKYQLERAAKATAEANIIQLEADILKLIRDTVVVNKTGAGMNESQLVTYQKLMMLQAQKEAHFVYSGGPVEPVNVQAARTMSGVARRLLDDVAEL
mmetsp:Transcript_123436/g.356882  ORF Transcript_123436/g.356882 Transcript_123436/m.356882 type:complete len:355 (+) Transcript_123436:106-1170(+)|eukprot:CAMPEP_0176111244 /NCGR_PEP_ID=MMETSP0120_2-20121206/55863_1 /TAXON_ID=160619 /ORGANISM="Kryptoperidinium foliaceum, Strain CCMP 1326" /LENGTH=354 /DNA_ID=CAMNT_0017445459 /DNA_START=38 /DNA_END=1102 /DNA_ORIENTATION=+